MLLINHLKEMVCNKIQPFYSGCDNRRIAMDKVRHPLLVSKCLQKKLPSVRITINLSRKSVLGRFMDTIIGYL